MAGRTHGKRRGKAPIGIFHELLGSEVEGGGTALETTRFGVPGGRRLAAEAALHLYKHGDGLPLPTIEPEQVETDSKI